MKLISWNINSVRARGERLVNLIKRHAPDIVCLQEIKVTTDKFPLEAVTDLGYQAAVHGQKAYNGVAILAKGALTDISCDLQDGVDDGQARLLGATFDGVRIMTVYVPNGSKVGTDKYAYKLAWMRRLRAHLDARHSATENLVVCGDFNVAPRRCDVAKPEQWEPTVLFHPEVRAQLTEIEAFGLQDVFARHHPEGGVYSWWDYRMLGFQKNNGLRIDVIYATGPLAERCRAASVDREERKGTQPSDHAPVIAEFA